MPDNIVFAAGVLSLTLATTAAMAQTEPEVAACKASGLIALQETSPGVKDLLLDPDTLIVAKANTRIENTPVKGVVTGEVYLKTDKSDKPRHMICLLGEKGKVLLTFFTQR